MKILFNFIISIIIFIYGINLFSKSLESILGKNIQTSLKKYTKSPLKGIFLGTFITSIVQSSTLITIITIGLVNANILSFPSSLGIMMGANLGTCVTSWFVSLLKINSDNQILVFLNPNTYIPLLLLIGLFFFFKKKKRKSNCFLGLSLFMLGLNLMQKSLLPIQEFTWFKNLLISLSNPFLGLFIGIIITCIIQSSSATVAILQTVADSSKINYLMTIPIIMGENIGTCLTTLIASINTSKNAKKVAISHLLYNIIGTIIFFTLFYLCFLLKSQFLEKEVNSFDIALIHTLFNFFSILIFYPFLHFFEKLINKLVK